MEWLTPVLSDEDEVHRRLKRVRAQTDRRSKPDLWKELDQAISDDRDPVGAISYDAGGNLFGLTTSAAPQLAAAPSAGASVGDEVTLSGITFDAVRDNNVVTFNGIRATNTSLSADRLTLKCLVPAGATTGPLTVTYNGQSFGLPSYTVLSTANITISAIR